MVNDNVMFFQKVGEGVITSNAVILFSWLTIIKIWQEAQIIVEIYHGWKIFKLADGPLDFS